MQTSLNLTPSHQVGDRLSDGWAIWEVTGLEWVSIPYQETKVLKPKGRVIGLVALRGSFWNVDLLRDQTELRFLPGTPLTPWDGRGLLFRSPKAQFIKTVIRRWRWFNHACRDWQFNIPTHRRWFERVCQDPQFSVTDHRAKISQTAKDLHRELTDLMATVA